MPHTGSLEERHTSSLGCHGRNVLWLIRMW